MQPIDFAGGDWRCEFDESGFEMIEHLRRGQVQVERLQTSVVLIGGTLCGRVEAIEQGAFYVRIDRNEVEDMAAGVAKANVLFLASEIGHFDEKLVVLVFLREYLKRKID